MESSVTLPKKKVYQAPKLLKYGSLTEMTAAVSLRGMRDSMAGVKKTG